MSNILIYLSQILFLFECKSNLTKENYLAHETQKIFREMVWEKSPELYDEVSEQAIKLSGTETILTIKSTFGNIWKSWLKIDLNHFGIENYSWAELEGNPSDWVAFSISDLAFFYSPFHVFSFLLSRSSSNIQKHVTT